MADICPKCGLPKELCTCGVREREEKKITVTMEKRKWGKPATLITGVSEEGKRLSKQLKSRLACGGTFKDGHVMLQGDHRPRIKDVLVKLGYDEDKIEVM